MDSVILIVCPNYDGLHEGPTANYLIFGTGAIVDDPDYEELIAVREVYGKPMRILYVPCSLCKKKGVKGLSHFPSPREP